MQDLTKMGDEELVDRFARERWMHGNHDVAFHSEETIALRAELLRRLKAAKDGCTIDVSNSPERVVGVSVHVRGGVHTVEIPAATYPGLEIWVKKTTPP